MNKERALEILKNKRIRLEETTYQAYIDSRLTDKPENISKWINIYQNPKYANYLAWYADSSPNSRELYELFQTHTHILALENNKKTVDEILLEKMSCD
jgi:hypothetical protein